MGHKAKWEYFRAGYERYHKAGREAMIRGIYTTAAALATATRAVVSVSERTLWGNAASAVVAAYQLPA